MIRIGLFGGTFDPPHRGHVAVARDVADALRLDRVLWIPVGTPPHRDASSLSPAQTRLAMVRAAVAADARFQATDLELRRAGPSYTVDTIREVRTAYPDAELFFLIGADEFRALPTWKDPEAIMRLARFAVMDRGGTTARSVAPELRGIERSVYVPVERVDVSASEVRARVRRGEPIDELVPDAVVRIVARAGLYRPDDS